MELVVEKWLTIYGPLGVGWIAAALLYLRLMKLSDRVLTAFVEHTKVVETLVERINQALAVRQRAP